MSDVDRTAQIAAAVEHLVKPGEAWIVRRDDSELEVVEEGRSSLCSTQPDLYGRMLQINERISAAGASFLVFGMLGVLAVCLAIHMRWLNALLGPAAETVRSFWVYGFAVLAAFILFATIAQAWERIVYGQLRGSLVDALEKARLSPHRLMAEIEGDESLDDLADRLKTDYEFLH